MSTLKEMLHDGRVTCSWARVTDLLSFPRIKGGRCAECARSTDLSDAQWFGTKNFEEALALADTGWDEGAAAALQRPEYLTDFTMAAASGIGWGFSDTEGEVVWDKLLSGSDFYLQRPTLTTGFRQACRVIVSVTASAAIHPSSMLERAIDIAAGVAALDRMRVQTELWVTIPDQSNHHYSFRVHQTGDTFNLGKTAFFCGHPSLLRRIVFGLKERASVEAQRVFGSGYGYSADLSPEVLERIALPPWEGDTIVIGTCRTNDVKANTAKVKAGFAKALRTYADSPWDSIGTINVDM